MTGWKDAAIADRQEPLGSSLIQHGKNSNRIYLMHLAGADVPWILEPLADLARKQGYGKIFAKVPAGLLPPFQTDGYEIEAVIPGFFKGGSNGYFLARYFDPARKQPRDQERIRKILAECRMHTGAPRPATGYRLRRCGPADIESMAALFREVFPSYPFPIHDPAYLRRTMQTRVVYFGAWHGEELAALAAAEQETGDAHAELTDFATSPRHRRQGLASSLLFMMEQEIWRHGFQTAYTIARATSPGMNLSFAGAGYCFAGTLINNTQISGRIESMNVWYKKLTSAENNSSAGQESIQAGVSASVACPISLA
jgi:beta-lysine N6-acetyltransferase